MDPDDVAFSLVMAAEGSVRAVIDCILPLTEAAHAHELVEGRTGLGKVLLDPAKA